MKFATMAILASLWCALSANAETPKACGGFGGEVQCSAKEWCDYPQEHACGVGDHMGECKVRPDRCTKEVVPVCGCDGKTYGNSCEANAAGTDVVSMGPCEKSAK